MVHAYTFRFPQEVETDPSVLTYGRFRVRFAYGRSGDSRRNDDPGQDYLALRVDRERLAFALCDGVSQSFYGDLAAHVLGDLLLDWLWTYDGKLSDESFQQKLTGQLNSWTLQGQDAVESFHLPDDIAPMVRGVLEKKRALGSETMFVAGLLTLPGRDLPDGQLCLAWLGDSRLQLHREDLDLTTSLGADFSSEFRWSTHAGVKSGEPGVYIKPPGAAERVLAYSDGLEPVEHLLIEADEADLAAYIQDLQTSPTSDDISFLDVMLLPEPAREKMPLIAPLSPKVGEDGLAGIPAGPSVLSWNDIAGAEGYDLALKLTDGNVRSLESAGRTYPFADIEGGVCVRVRARRGDETGPWSGWTDLKPAAAVIREAVVTAPDAAVVDMLTPVQESEPVSESKADAKPARPFWLPWAPAAVVVILALIFGPRLLGGGEEILEPAAVQQEVVIEEAETVAEAEVAAAEEAVEPAPTETAVAQPGEMESELEGEPVWLDYPETLSEPPDGGLVRVGKGLPVDAAFSTDGNLVFLATNTGLYSLDPDLQEQVAFPVGQRLTALAVNPDGVELAAGDAAGHVWILNQADLSPLADAELPGGAVQTLAFSIDGALAAGLEDGSVQLREDGSWQEIIPAGESAVSTIAFSADGMQLACGFTGGGTVQYSLAGEDTIPLRYYLEHEQLLPAADGWWTLLGNGSLLTWDERGEVTGSIQGRFSRAAYGVDGSIVLAGDADGGIMRQSASGAESSLLEEAGHVLSLDTAADGRVLWLNNSGVLGVVEPAGNSVIREIVPTTLRTAWLDAEAGHLFWTGMGGGVHGRSLEDGSLLENLPPVRSSLSSISGSEAMLMSGFNAGGALLVEPQTQALHVLLAYPGEVTTVVIASDGSYAAAGTAEGAVNIWDLANRDWRVTVFSGRSTVTALAVDPVDPGRLWTANSNGRLAVWDSETGELLRELVDEGPAVDALALAPDGGLLAYAEPNGVVLLDSTGETDPVRLEVVSPRVLMFSPDGDILAVGSEPGPVTLWTLDGVQLEALAGHTGPVAALDFMPDGEVLWSASLDGTAIAWQVEGE